MNVCLYQCLSELGAIKGVEGGLLRLWVPLVIQLLELIYWITLTANLMCFAHADLASRSGEGHSSTVYVLWFVASKLLYIWLWLAYVTGCVSAIVSSDYVMSTVSPTLFPTLTPSQLNQAWFPETNQLADESVIMKAETAYEAWKSSFATHGDGVIQYGEKSYQIFLFCVATYNIWLH